MGHGVTRFFKVKVHPEANINRLKQKAPDAFEIWIKEPPRAGRANAKALELLAKELGFNPKYLCIVKGHASRNKIIALLGSSPPFIL